MGALGQVRKRRREGAAGQFVPCGVKAVAEARATSGSPPAPVPEILVPATGTEGWTGRVANPVWISVYLYFTVADHGYAFVTHPADLLSLKELILEHPEQHSYPQTALLTLKFTAFDQPSVANLFFLVLLSKVFSYQYSLE